MSSAAESTLNKDQKIQIVCISLAWIGVIALSGNASNQTANRIASAGPMSNNHSW